MFGAFINVDYTSLEPLFDKRSREIDSTIPVDLRTAQSATDFEYFEFLKQGLVTQTSKAKIQYNLDFDIEQFSKDVLALDYSEVEPIPVPG